eukprot:CAMPEP_0172447840 /NCGR_PEP_ID=MMETSP1065-20121228/7027_1 /TAXON_ID=265537 /ORGANISM="Amphiprora paludosa, Strain CCMP125" /LENGTH=116 /DNA_ID=CAMNT_0013199211 /DNA_START=68 /DNA_END=418 /DNA_ORIENTATION=+
MSDELHYPNLANCRVSLRGASGVEQVPVRLPTSCVTAAETVKLPTLYDFALERKVLAAHEERTAAFAGGSSPDEIKKSVLTKMKSVTKAEDGVCVAILEDNQYDLKTSIETFFASS